MDKNKFFRKLCWVCMAEKKDMHSMLNDKLKVRFDNVNAPVSLHNILTYVVASDIRFDKGPHFICNVCKNQACAAYKFKKRCEVSINIFKNCGLNLRKETADNLDVESNETQTRNELNVELENLKSVTDISKDITTKSHTKLQIIQTLDLTEEDELLPKLEFHDLAVKDEFVANASDSNINRDMISKVSSSENERTDTAPLSQSSRQTFLCTICGLEKSKNCMKEHMWRHANIRNHKCTYCGKLFNDKGNLKVHIRIHTGDHPYLCKVCGKTFTQSTGLKIHQRVHDDVKPYKCHICSYCTRTSSHLQLHIKRHVGIKNYRCQQCNYAACSSAELKYHMATHSDDKCHLCKICGKGFTRIKSLKTHEKSHSGEKPHVCEICGRGFTQAHSLRSHLRNIHKNANDV